MSESISKLTPRQKMINLMYIVLTAMLALNVSSDVLDGFTQVEDGLSHTNKNVGNRNDAIYTQLLAFTDLNPDKGSQWLVKASEVRGKADELFSYIDSLKLVIVKEADGKDGVVSDIRRKDDTEAASVVMLSPGNNLGKQLRSTIDTYRDYIVELLPDTAKRRSVSESLSTAPYRRPGTVIAQQWEEAKFENQPVVAAVTLLTKLQNDVRYAEGEALASLLSAVDAGDVRVNDLNAFVIPRSQMVMKGGKYSANIVLAAVDTTARPAIYVQGKRLTDDNGVYELSTTSTGTFDYSGYLEVSHGDGTVTTHPFKSEYTVLEPAATVSATMMNLLYAGIDNPISISVPGVATSEVSATMTNGMLSRRGNQWVARPVKVGEDAVVTVTATIDGVSQPVSTSTFRVRQLPDPTAFVSLKGDDGTVKRFKGNRPINRNNLLASPGIEAAIDDDILNIDFKVLSFETVFFDQMGNAIPEVSDGSSFSRRQKDRIKRLGRGKRFYISHVKAIGPDGVERVLNPVEVIVQ